MDSTAISNMDDVIDSRDVIERIAELQEEISAEIATEGGFPTDKTDELGTLLALAAEAADYSEDWEYGATLIRDSYFVEYAQRLADDIGMLDNNATWPYTCIDWEWAARELQADYTGVSFAGVDYWIR